MKRFYPSDLIRRLQNLASGTSIHNKRDLILWSQKMTVVMAKMKTYAAEIFDQFQTGGIKDRCAVYASEFLIDTLKPGILYE